MSNGLPAVPVSRTLFQPTGNNNDNNDNNNGNNNNNNNNSNRNQFVLCTGSGTTKGVEPFHPTNSKAGNSRCLAPVLGIQICWLSLSQTRASAPA